MKKSIQILSGFLFGLTIIITGCKKKEEVIPVTSQNTTPADSTLAITKDTLYAPAGDGGSRTFFNSVKLLVFTQDSINKNLNLSDDVIFGYSFSTDPAVGAELANTYTFSATTLTGWHQKATIFRKNVSSAVYDSAFFKRAIVSAWNSATPYTGSGQGGYIAPLAVNEIYAFQTEAGKHGLVKIIAIKPGQDPYADYLVFQVKMEK
jgi:hypothetical protein